MRYYLDIESNNKFNFISKFEIYDNEINVLYNGYRTIGEKQSFIKLEIKNMIPINDDKIQFFINLPFYSFSRKKIDEFLIENNMIEWRI